MSLHAIEQTQLRRRRVDGVGRPNLISTRVRTDSFRLLEPFNQLHVLGDVALGVREAVQDLVLELAHFYFEARLLLDEHFRHFAEIGALLAQYEHVQLITETRLRHREVDERRLRLDLRRVVRI